MDKLFTSVSSLWVLFVPLLTVSKVGFVDWIDDCNHNTNHNSNHNGREIITMIKQLGELRESGLITEEEFMSKKRILLDHL